MAKITPNRAGSGECRIRTRKGNPRKMPSSPSQRAVALSGIPESERLFELACQLIPGGVNTPIRSFEQVGGVPRFIASAKGCFITDVDGHEYIDYVGSWGAAILGHGHPALVDRTCAAIRKGASFGLPCESEVEVAREITHRIRGVEQVRLVNTGTEAVLSAVRLARHATGRNLILKFEGCYHGQVDDLMHGAVASRDMARPFEGGNSKTIVLRYNDADALRRCFSENGPNIGGVIIEPVAANMGIVPPEAGFLELLRGLTDSAGALLIFDEVVTGFRLCRGGAQEAFGVAPDIFVMGKALAGGLPIGAYGSRRSLMSLVAPVGPVYQGGTFSGNPVTCAASLATLSMLHERDYAKLQAMGDQLREGLTELFRQRNIRASVQQVGSMLSTFFGVDRVTHYGEASSASSETYAKFFHSMLKAGVHLPARPLEGWFISLAHTHEIIEDTLRLASQAVRDLP
jgi:glutamate-1-semialdehyde 2,1-aminomutase